MRILYAGTLEWGSTSLQRMRALSNFAEDIYSFDRRIFVEEYVRRTLWQRLKIRLEWPPLVKSLGDALLREVERYRPDCVWVDQGILFSSKVLANIRKIHSCLLVHYTADSLRSPVMKFPFFRQALSQYDICFTTKKKELELYRKLGTKHVFFSWQGYDPSIHRPIELSATDKDRFYCDVVFIGQRMVNRARLIEHLVKNVDCNIHLYGCDWNKGRTGRILGPLQHGWLYGDDYAKAIVNAKLGLCFLNQEVEDEYTTRSFEIPACGTMMLAERTEAHRSLFEEDREAVYFETAQELLEKVRYYIAHDELRRRIAMAGYKRAISSSYTWKGRMAECINFIEKFKNRKKINIQHIK